MMKTTPTYRRGRRYYRPGAADSGGIAGFCSVLFIVLLLLVPPVILVVSEFYRHDTYRTLSSALENGIHSLSAKSGSAWQVGDMVHATSSSIDATAADPDVDVSIAGALGLARNTEYCQWQEIRREDCRTCTREVTASDGSRTTESYDCDCVVSYDYIKSWKPYRINSFLFDQPAAHNNPQRDPMPSEIFPALDATIEVAVPAGKDTGNRLSTESITAILDPSMLDSIRGTWRKVNWVHGGVPPTPNWFMRGFQKLFGRWMPPDKTLYLPLKELRGTEVSLAAQQDNFVYVGQGGYFFSPYQEGRASMLFKYFIEYLEGSLFDWQLGDLMPSCTAGDVRFSYQVIDPPVISVLGEARSIVGGKVMITPKVMENNGRSLGLVHAGAVSAEGMIEAEDSQSMWKAMVPRLVLLVWSAAFSRLLGALVGKNVGNARFATRLAAAVALSCAVLGATWAYLWGLMIVDTIALLVGAVLLAGVAIRHTPKASAKAGLRAAWCMVGKWARVPPSWRVQDSYGQIEGRKQKYQ